MAKDDVAQLDDVECTCAAAEYAERWLANTYGQKIMPGEERRYVNGMVAFITGYHTAVHLIKTALHDVPDAAGNINVAAPDAAVN